ncbi:MAG: hypothetical protein EOO07_32525 [Chitinophagaceae bacterium]|nr:MAG: hypothetical protein EOO07_32525 [Chitinophagaceae bacterium]
MPLSIRGDVGWAARIRSDECAEPEPTHFLVRKFDDVSPWGTSPNSSEIVYLSVREIPSVR